MIQTAFLQKIGYEGQSITFDDLPVVLKKMAFTFPFENRAVLNKQSYALNQEGLKQHLLEGNRGGLCYDLNPLLYYVLKEAGLSVQLLQGTVYIKEADTWAIDGTHVAIMLKHHNERFLIDAGFGVNLPLQPVPFTEDWVEGASIRFRVKAKETEKGTHLLQLDKGDGTETGYAFTLNEVDESVLAQMRHEIYENESSPFNKRPLASKLTPTGRVIVTEDHVTTHEHEEVSKKPLPIPFEDYVKKLIP
ncbi:arylamine N-acetyltransferase [Bacillus sp. FSL L8-0167]|uniref:arylamine N-acetyltransferase family protein n=1 Tax=Bacillus TaxID=1386 RepID=UPI00061B23CF|nr:arylamine N-acetyltransferase [Bacillus safensis]KKD41363.1 acetyltransferase [Bacillus safensis]MCM3450072.1 arylamine N-acetyltransferase [Bacillus safensis]MDR6682387.1 N-hydroxyarylamine O-acetyltransferase [Bacillus safensis]MEC0948053.1 arylamine N-acetyltransferase [Bacillus safensis]MED5091634.1 arylamine N-acetyltransferase [Bacillus safensis]